MPKETDPAHVFRLPIPDPDTPKICKNTQPVGQTWRGAVQRPSSCPRNSDLHAKYNELMLNDGSPLTRLEREMIAVVVFHNHCVYCIVALSGCARVFHDPETFW